MNEIIEVLRNVKNMYGNPSINEVTILSVLLVVTILAVYEFVIYRYVSHRAFYNKSFNVTIAVLPYFIATIILCLQSNIVVTLGTIGALAIIRFRTAVKDPVDMMYILWAVYIGIICGCQLYQVAFLTSIAVTVVLFCLEHFDFGKKPFVLIMHCKDNNESKIEEIIKSYSKKYRIKSRNYTSNGIDYAIEFSTKNLQDLLDKLSKEKSIERFSVIEYDADDIV